MIMTYMLLIIIPVLVIILGIMVLSIIYRNRTVQHTGASIINGSGSVQFAAGNNEIQDSFSNETLQYGSQEEPEQEEPEQEEPESGGITDGESGGVVVASGSGTFAFGYTSSTYVQNAQIGAYTGGLSGQQFAPSIDNLPTEDPKVEGQLWNDNGEVKTSLGEGAFDELPSPQHRIMDL